MTHRSTRARADARANRLRVMEAACAVFAVRGTAAEIKEIALRAGVGVATIYRAVGGKRDLLAAAAEQAAVEFRDLLAAAEAESDPVAAMRVLIGGSFEQFDRFGWLFRLVLADRETQQLVHDGVAARHDRAQHTTRVRRLVERGVESGAYRRDLPIDVVLALIRGGLLSRMEVGPALPQVGREEMVDGIIRLLRPADRPSPGGRSPS